jgi:hypothetical protein
MAALCPESREPKNSQFFFPRAMGRMAFNLRQLGRSVSSVWALPIH